MAFAKGIPLKKRHGQHFLRNQAIANTIVDYCNITGASVLEIGCGDGFLTRTMLQREIARLWVFEIDKDWVDFVRARYPDSRLTILHENFLDVDFTRLDPYKPWVVLANLPYQVTFPILHVLQREIHLLKEGVIMVQEEVAQKILKKSGRGYGYPSLFFQYYFELKMLNKVPPKDFYPPPKVFSRLLYFKPRFEREPIPDEQEFWKFIKLCFRQPRRTLRNNLMQTHYDMSNLDQELLGKRGQQLDMNQLLQVWNKVRS